MKKEFTRTKLKNAIAKNLIVGRQYSLPQIKRAIEYPHDISGQGRWHFLRALNEVCYLVPNTKNSRNYIYNGIVPKMRKVELQDIITETGMYIPYDEKRKNGNTLSKSLPIEHERTHPEDVKLKYAKCVRKRIENIGWPWLTNSDLFEAYFKLPQKELLDLNFANGQYLEGHVSFFRTLASRMIFSLFTSDRGNFNKNLHSSVDKSYIVADESSEVQRLATETELRIIRSFFEKGGIGTGSFYNSSNFANHMAALKSMLVREHIVFYGACYKYNFDFIFKNEAEYTEDVMQETINEKVYNKISKEIDRQCHHAESKYEIERLFYEWAELRLGIKTELPKLKVGMRPWEKKKQ